jgi:hypothetical protein
MIVKASDFTVNPSFHLSPEFCQYGIDTYKKHLIYAGETGEDSLVIAIPNCQIYFKSHDIFGITLNTPIDQNAELVDLLENSIIANLPGKLSVSPDKVFPLYHESSPLLTPSLKRKDFKLSAESGGEPDLTEFLKERYPQPRKALVFLHIAGVSKCGYTGNYALQYEVSQIHLTNEGPVSVADICDNPAQFL